MAKASISIGVDDATGQPDSAPAGPYITDEDDGTRPRKRKRSRAPAGANDETSRASDRNKPAPSEDLASRRKGPAQP